MIKIVDVLGLIVIFIAILIALLIPAIPIIFIMQYIDIDNSLSLKRSIGIFTLLAFGQIALYGSIAYLLELINSLIS